MTDAQMDLRAKLYVSLAQLSHAAGEVSAVLSEVDAGDAGDAGEGFDGTP